MRYVLTHALAHSHFPSNGDLLAADVSAVAATGLRLVRSTVHSKRTSLAGCEAAIRMYERARRAWPTTKDTLCGQMDGLFASVKMEEVMSNAMIRESETTARVNGVNVEALRDTIATVRREPTLGRATFRAHNSWKGQALNETVIGDFYCAGGERQHKKRLVYQNDEGLVLLGNDDAANPVEFILHGLAGCVTTTTVYHAAAHGIHIESLETTLEGDLDLQGLLQTDRKVPSGYKDVRVSMKIKSDATGEQLEMLKGFFRHSPVLDTLKRPVNVDVNVVTD